MFKLHKKTLRMNSIEAFACSCYCQSALCSCTTCSHCYCEDFSPNSYVGLTENFRASGSSNIHTGLIAEGANTSQHVAIG